MIKPNKLNKGDKVAIVSLSSGVLGEPFVKHELDLAIKRLKDFGLEVVFMPNSLKGIEYLANNPYKRAEDLKLAFSDLSIKAIICAIGGNDTYKTLPYLLNDEEFRNNIKNNPKIFMGFSDTTINHLMFYKLGLITYYGPCLLVDFAELDKEMLPYTKEWVEKLFSDEKNIEIKSSPFWYNERTDFSEKALGTSRVINEEKHGCEVLNGKGIVTGNLIGGCIESLYSCLEKKLNIFPTEWEDKILFLETSDSKISPKELEKILIKLKETGFFSKIKGLIIGKPQDEKYYEEYKEVYLKILKEYNLPIMYNLNFGHAFPRCILPYGATIKIDFDNKKVYLIEGLF